MCLQSFALKPNYHISLIYCRPNAKPERVYLYILSRWELRVSLCVTTELRSVLLDLQRPQQRAILADGSRSMEMRGPSGAEVNCNCWQKVPRRI